MPQNKGKLKYYVLMENLKQDIIEGRIRAGDKIPSENELAGRYQISRHTVRKALSILENDGLVEAVHGKGTFCSYRRLNKGNSHNIAVVTTYISDYIFPRLIQGMDHILTDNGYSIILKNTANSQKNEAKALQDILTKNIDGLIIEPSKSEIYCRHMSLYESFDAMQIPYIFIQGTYPQMKNKPNIIMDDVEGGYLLTRHLLEWGHENIIGIFKVDDVQGTGRHKGYIKALEEAGIAYDPDRVILFHTEDREKKPAAMVKEFLQRKAEIDGIVCYNDQIALEIIQVLNRKGIRVPEDISVTGYDNSFMAVNGPIKLTTVSHPQERLGEMAAELLLEKLRGISDEDSGIPRVIRPRLIVGESTKKRV